jgi:hypothetical protein
MTSKPQSTTTAKPSPSLAEAVSSALTSHQYDDVIGPIPVNVVDALMAIANAINRLAASNENMLAAQVEIAEMSKQQHLVMMSMMGSDRPGHA